MLLKNKKFLISGLANKYSIAAGIASAMHREGAELAFTYQNERLLKNLRPIAKEFDSTILLECDVSSDEAIDKTFNLLKKKWNSIDFLVHAIAYSDKEELKGEYVDTTRENFYKTMDISVYSFTAVAQRAAEMMTNGGSMITLTYYGAEKVMPHYNVMGVAKAALESSVRYLAADLGDSKIRVNSLSAGPIKTLAASGIGDFRYILKWNQYNSPLRRNVTLDDVGGCGVYLLSDLSAGVTGELHHVDCGYHVVGMKAIDAPDMSPQKNGFLFTSFQSKFSLLILFGPN